MRISHYLELDKKMKNLRVSSGMSQKDMAAKLDLSVPSYSNYENGYSEPPMEILQKFCEILNVSVSDLFGFNVPANTKTNLRTYSDILRLIISLKKAGFNVDCSVTPDKETRRTKVNIAVENPNLSSMLSKWNELNDDLEKDKIDSDEYNIWIEDLMTSFNYPIEII
ncbi:MAG: helix-turn-helix transcriptional regulator [Bacilli bacterium]|nr:helix-turn-helix transcriptional regulator [Bacilli bacterium]